MLFFLKDDFVVDILLMHYIFEPVARTMTLLQAISILVWKAHEWTKHLVEWLHRASIECNEFGDFDYFPTLKEYGEVRIVIYF